MKVTKIIASVAVILILLLSPGCETEPDWIGELTDEIFSQINLLRTGEGLDKLVWHSELAGFAADHSRDMGVRDYFSHTTPEGKTFSERIADSGIDYGGAGENIYMRAGDCSDIPAEDVTAGIVDGWWNSPGHREIMIRENMTHGAVGCYQSESALYVTFNVIN